MSASNICFGQEKNRTGLDPLFYNTQSHTCLCAAMKLAVKENPVEEQADLGESTHPLPRGSSEEGHCGLQAVSNE